MLNITKHNMLYHMLCGIHGRLVKKITTVTIVKVF